MKLTIVTTTYNQEKYIRQAIDGMLMQKTDFDFQIVISNDCSKDNTAQILEKYRRKYPSKIKVINNKKNLGAMKNFINTLDTVKDSQYVALCDGDDFWTDENKLQKQVDFLDRNKDFNICFHKARLFYENKEKRDEIIPKNIKEVSTVEDLSKGNYIVANSVVYRWKFNNKSLKESFPEDIVPGDYYIHLLHAVDGKIKMIDEVMSAYRRHKDGMWWSNDSANKEKFTLVYGRKLLNFYNAVDEYINLPKELFLDQRKDNIYNLIITYVRNDKFAELKDMFVSKEDIEVAGACMKDIVNRNIWFLDYLDNREAEEERIKLEREREEQEREMYYNREIKLLREKLESIEYSRWWRIRNMIKKDSRE